MGTGGERNRISPRAVAAMAFVRWLLVAGSAAAAVGSIASYAKAGRQRGGASATARQYVCPMHPAVVLDHPGACPICNMELVVKLDATAPPAEKAAQAPAASLPVELARGRLCALGMRTATVARAMMGGELHTVGVVDPVDRDLAQVRTQFPGRVDELRVSETTGLVRRGQILATIDSPDLLRAERDLLAAHGAHPDGASAMESDAGHRLQTFGMSGADIAELLRLGKPEQRIAVRAPIDGYLIGNRASRGLMFAPRSVLFEVADLRRVWISVDVSELDAGLVHVGQRARVDVPALPHEPHAGTVELVSPAVDRRTRTLSVRIEVENAIDASGPHLRPGMYATVHLDTPPRAALTVPAGAVVDTGTAHYLFAANERDQFVPRLVSIGSQAEGKVEVLSGVREGDTVVATANLLVDSENRLLVLEHPTQPSAPER